MTYSQFNEDEVIARLLAEHGSGTKRCVDIGARGVMNSNVANLIIHHGWWGFLFDRGLASYKTLIATYGPFDDNEIDRAACHKCGGAKRWPVAIVKDIISPRNVNALLPERFDLLSIDIDGQDYHVWEAIAARPKIVVIEYNPNRPGHYVMPLNAKYEADRDPRNREWGGASKDALVALGARKGYRLADANAHNLFFVRND